jgi:hypothetical protein
MTAPPVKEGRPVMLVMGPGIATHPPTTEDAGCAMKTPDGVYVVGGCAGRGSVTDVRKTSDIF